MTDSWKGLFELNSKDIGFKERIAELFESEKDKHPSVTRNLQKPINLSTKLINFTFFS